MVTGANGGLSWLAFNGRPELCAAASMIPRGFKDAQTDLVTDVNFAIKLAQTTKYAVTVWPIPAEQRRYAGIYDASFDPKGERNQLGRLVGCVTPRLNQGQEDRFSLGTWKSQKLENKAGSPNATETHACARVVADVVWYRALVESMTWSDWSLELQRRSGQPSTRKTPYVMSVP